jgi:hypothetical protein
MHDLYNNLGVVEAIAPDTYDADTTPAAIDLLGFDSAVIALQIGAGGITFTGTNKIEFVLSHSDNGVDFAPVTDADVLGADGIASGIIVALTAAHASPTTHRFGYIGEKRYLKLLADFGGTHATGTPIAATVIKGNARSRPVAA